MSDLNFNESWQIEINGHISDSNFEELTHKIAEGSLTKEDRVRCGQLGWMNAGKVPSLSSFFNARAKQLSSSVVVSTNAVQSTAPSVTTQQFTNIESAPVRRQPVEWVNATFSPDRGDAADRAIDLRDRSMRDGFGFNDFRAAAAYPFRFRTSLIFGALVFMIVSVGQLAWALGGTFMLAASIISYMLANMLAFGVLSTILQNFRRGLTDRNFMPRIDGLSLWDDIAHPFVLSIGTYVSSFGAFIPILLVGMYLVMSAVSSQMDAMKTKLETTPGTPYYNVRDTADQSEQVKQVLANTERQDPGSFSQHIANVQSPAITVDRTAEDVKRVPKAVSENNRKELEAAVGRSAENTPLFTELLRLSPPLVVIGFIALVWGLFYFPAACIVAGYRRSFTAAIDPLVGLETIKRLGFDYVKLLLMELTLLMALGIIGSALAFVFGPFDMAGIGNLPAKAIGSVFFFYAIVVFAYTLGFAMLKDSGRLRSVR